jgi:hypothetical protein
MHSLSASLSWEVGRGALAAEVQEQAAGAGIIFITVKSKCVHSHKAEEAFSDINCAINNVLFGTTLLIGPPNLHHRFQR